MVPGSIGIEEYTSSGTKVNSYTNLVEAFNNAGSGNTLKVISVDTTSNYYDTATLAAGKTLIFHKNSTCNKQHKQKNVPYGISVHIIVSLALFFITSRKYI